MNGVVNLSDQGFDKVVFEHVLDTYPGGATFDATDFTNADNIIPKGTLVGIDASGLAVPVVITPGVDDAPATLAPAPIGFVGKTVKIDNNPLIAIYTAGTLRKAALDSDVQDAIAEVASALPRWTII